jgi:hypothetical protein
MIYSTSYIGVLNPIRIDRGRSQVGSTSVSSRRRDRRRRDVSRPLCFYEYDAQLSSGKYDKFSANACSNNVWAT